MDLYASLKDLVTRVEALEQADKLVDITPPPGVFVTRDDLRGAVVAIGEDLTELDKKVHTLRQEFDTALSDLARRIDNVGSAVAAPGDVL